MGILDKIRSLKEGALKEYKKFANDDLRIGTMAALAMVAQANGQLKQEEIDLVTALINHDEDLQVYGIDKCLEDFTKCVNSYKLSEYIGKPECMAKVKKVTDPEQKKLLVAKVCAIGAADGDFDKNERAVAVEICTALNVPTNQFGL